MRWPPCRAVKVRHETTAVRFPPEPQRPAAPPRMGVAAAGAACQTQRVSGAEYPCGRTDGLAGEKHPQGGAGGVAGSQHNQRCSKPTVSECYTRLCARFPEFIVGGDSNVLRIGRKADPETIEMWSTHEGQQKIETHGDKLMNYIRFWQAAGESEKTSIRTRDRIRQIVSSGHYTGGFVCYGYQLVDQGRRNKRDKPVMDLVINEEEATWVRELFYKVIQEGTSGYALAEMLNNRGLRTRAGAKFQSSNILRIIRHEGYTGYIITKNARSEYIPELQIIDQETFEKANDIISRRSAKTAQDRRIAHTSQNPTLLAGIVYCAHCGAKMSGFMHTDRYKLADGSIREKVQPKYNCFQRGQRNKGGRDCDGQALYLAERVDAIVLKIVEEVFEQIRDTPYSQVAENRIRQESNLQKTKRAAAEKKIKAAQHALERFEGEILKCLDGTSNFTEDMIAKQIRRYQQELDDAKAEYAELQNARLNEAAEIRKLRTYYDDFKGWAEEFDTAPLEMKRMILSHLIDRVEIGRKYQVIVKFNMKYRQFLECTAETYNTEIGA